MLFVVWLSLWFMIVLLGTRSRSKFPFPTRDVGPIAWQEVFKRRTVGDQHRGGSRADDHGTRFRHGHISGGIANGREVAARLIAIGLLG